MAEYIAQVFPFSSIKSRYAGKKKRWICPSCGQEHLIEKLPVIYLTCSCGGWFDYVEREKFNNKVTKVNLKEF